MRHVTEPFITQNSDPPSSSSAARLGVIRVWTVNHSPLAARRSSVSTLATPTHSLIMWRDMGGGLAPSARGTGDFAEREA